MKKSLKIKKKSYKTTDTPSELPAQKLANPIVVHIKNTTDEKLYNVKVFDLNFEHQNKVAYSSEPREVSYKEFLLTHMTQLKVKIGRISVSTMGDYPKFRSKQLRSPIYIKCGSDTGNFAQFKVNIIVSPYQQQTDIAVADVSFDFIPGTHVQIELEYLMPEVSVSLYFYPFVNEQKKQNG